MVLTIIGVICLIGGVSYTIYKSHHLEQINTERKLENNKIEAENKRLKVYNKSEQEKYETLIKIFTEKQNEYNQLVADIQHQTTALNQTITDNEKIANEAYAEYTRVLEQAYQRIEYEIDCKLQDLQNKQDEKIQQMEIEKQKIADSLSIMKQTHQQTILLLQKEQLSKEEKLANCIPLSETEKLDIKMLTELKPRLHQPRILSMLIWQTYIQKKLKQLSIDILGKNIVCGIYKITNIETNACYIGQSKDIAKRWTEHAKCGLGIDTPQQNKLYQAMMRDGIESFSWELVELCKPEELNTKERYYIDLCDSVNYGYNITKGNK